MFDSPTVFNLAQYKKLFSNSGKWIARNVDIQIVAALRDATLLFHVGSVYAIERSVDNGKSTACVHFATLFPSDAIDGRLMAMRLMIQKVMTAGVRAAHANPYIIGQDRRWSFSWGFSIDMTPIQIQLEQSGILNSKEEPNEKA